MIETVGPPPQDIGVDPKATARGSGRHHRFKKLYRQTKLARRAEDSTPPVQTVERTKAGPRAKEVAVDPILESLGGSAVCGGVSCRYW